MTIRLLRVLGRRTWALLSLLFALMLVVPHAQWNNLYGFLGVVLITLLFFLAVRRAAGDGAAAGRGGVLRLLCRRMRCCCCWGLSALMHFGLSLRFFLFHVTCLLTVLLLSSAPCAPGGS
ncbi:MAG: hypothetical protein ACOX0U_05125 [Oscillospiraceae bacterium]